MTTESSIFWLIHLFIGIALPVMTFLGCCKEEEEAGAVSNRQPD